MNRLETKADLSANTSGEIAGIAWVFGLPDTKGDVIEKGGIGSHAGIPILFQHNTAQRIGTWTSAEETDLGLIVKGTLDIASNPLAKRVHDAVKAGKLTGLSIAFDRPPANEIKVRPDGGRTFSRINLVEISIAPTPLHGAARILETKSDTAKEMEVDDLNTESNNADPVDISALETKMAATDTELSGIKASLAKIEAKLSRPGIVTDRKSAEETKAAEARDQFAAYLRYGDKHLRADELKALTVSTDTAGGYFAPNEVSAEFIRDLVEFSPIRALASVRTTGAPSVTFPKRTGITNAKWKGENQPSEGSEPSFGQAEIVIREMTTHVDISNQLLADGPQALAEVNLALAEDFGVKEGTAFLHGDGVLAPAGIMKDAGVQHTLNGDPTELSADALISLMYALPAAYRQRGTWIMNGTTLATIRKIKDGAGNYLWQPAYSASTPEMILGRPVVEAVDMADVAADAFPILFGDFATAYRIVDRLALSTFSNPYLLATEGMTRIHATRRVGAGVVQAKALRKLKMATA
ncbi:phage major capsid protein [Xanthobacter wiegelii]|uniref:phage major capsid protein n=1 Tax=Xanthobacter wiegelii TaxID=3119913 RepID=UPI003727131D